jgi:Outer membrane efflux protein
VNLYLNKAYFAIRELLGVAIISMLVIGANRLAAEEPLPSQDEAITRAVENHPDILAAKAKLALAESELNGKRMDVSRQILQSYSNLKNSEAQASAIKAKLEAAKIEFSIASKAANSVPGAVSDVDRERLRADVQTQEAALVQTMLQREQTDKELRLLIGKTSATAPSAGSQSKAATRQIPQGFIIEKMRSALNDRTSIDVAEQPLSEWTQYISDRFHIPIQLHPDLKQTKDPTTTPVGVTLKDTPLPAMFQAIEDFNDGQIQFVVRDYGILLMNRDAAEKNGFMPLLEFVRESEKQAAVNRSPDDPWGDSNGNAARSATRKRTDAGDGNVFGDSKSTTKAAADSANPFGKK